MKTVMLVFGTRPEAIKMAPLVKFNKPMGVSTYTDNLMRMVEEHLDALQVVTDGAPL